MVNFLYAWFKYEWWIGIRQKEFFSTSGSRNYNYRSIFLNSISVLCLFVPEAKLVKLVSGSVDDTEIHDSAEAAMNQCGEFINIVFDQVEGRCSKIHGKIFVGAFYRTVMVMVKWSRENPRTDIVWPKGLTIDGDEISCLSQIGQFWIFSFYCWCSFTSNSTVPFILIEKKIT